MRSGSCCVLLQNLYDADATGAPMQNVHILLPPPQVSWLTAQAKQRGNISRAAVIRQLIAEEIKKQQPTA